MKITVESGKVKIQASGLEFLKLKTEITKRLGGIQTSDKDSISFPESSLYLVADLVNPNAEGLDQIEPSKVKFSSHGLARRRAIEILESNDVVGVPQFWGEILDPLQSTAVSAMVLPELLGVCLFDEQGSGKTVMTIAAFDVLKEQNSIDSMIVICPKSMLSEWPKDLNRFLPGKYNVIQAEGDRKQKNEAAYKDFDVLVTNYEGIEAMLTPLLAAADAKRYLLVVDESYYLKNSASVRSGKAERLRAKCQRCFVLCGTPAPNSAHDLLNQFNLADLGFTFGGFTKSSDATRDWERISQLVDERGLFIRRLKGEILDNVPEKNFHVIRVPLKGKQAIMYETARHDLELELKTFNNETFRRRLVSYFQRRAVLLQICCSPDSIDPMLSETPVKFEVLDDLLADLVSRGRKVIVWSFYKKSIDAMAVRYANYSPVRVDGSVSTSRRRDAVNSFQNDPNVKLFLGNPSAAGAGITLHAAYDAVYLSYSNQAAHYLQSLDRIHRRGQISNQVNYYLLVCQNTIEETEVIRLRGKEIRQNGLLRDQVPWPTSLDDALNELSGHA